MNIKSALMIYPKINKQILALNEDLNEVLEGKRVSEKSLKCSQISDMPRAGTVGNPTFESARSVIENVSELCDELEEYTKHCKNQIIDLILTKVRLDEALEALEHEERRVIELKYWLYPEPKYTWAKVFTEMPGYSDREVYRIHRRALEKLDLSVNVSKKVG